MIKFALQISGTALVLDKIINHVQSLQHEVEVRFYITDILGNCLDKRI